MNLDKERELFKQAYINSRSEDNISFPDVVFDEYLRLRENEGYKVVPVEPSLETMQNMNREFINSEFDAPKRRMQLVYKAMIGAVE